MPSWDHLKELFDKVVDLSPDDRAAYLDKLCGDDAALRAELQRLLDADEQAKSFMKVPAVKWTSSTNSVSPAVFSAGEKVAGRFRIVRFLGQGGMGQVYQAEDEVLGGFVALKAIRPEIASDEQTLERFKQEVRLAKAVTDENVCRVFDLDHHNVPPFITMELVEGETLGVRLHKGRMTTAEAFPLIEQMAQGLNAAHRKGIIHRDLKPGNIMLTGAGHGIVRAKVMDFGLARSLEGNTSMTGWKVGTPDYMAPELLAGGRATVSSDIYALGLVMFEMVTGTKPAFDRSRGPALSPCALIPGLDPSWAAAILRCLERDPARRPRTAMEIIGEVEPEISRARHHWQALRIAAILALLFAVAVWWWNKRSTRPERELVLSRITTDSGLSDYPAVSPDGKLLAYASDRDGKANLNIWLQQIGGGDPIRLTRHAADDSDPSFSPDGTKIAFRSELEGGGIYLVSTLGGEAQLLARGGRGPRFSPDGKWIAYWVGANGSGFLPGSARIYLLPLSGGAAQQFRPEFAAALSPIWSPGGRELLFLGRLGPKEDVERSVDWWIAPVQGGPVKKTGVHSELDGHQLIAPAGQDWITPAAWQAEGNRILFTATLADSTNIWEIPLLPKTGRVSGPVQRRTSGTGVEIHAAISEADGPRRMLYSSQLLNVGVWSAPIDATQGRLTGTCRKLTQQVSYAAFPSLSGDGRLLAFSSSGSGKWSVRVRNLETGRETVIANSPNRLESQISGDGSKVAYYSNRDRQIYLVDAQGGVAEKLCDECGHPTSVSWDGNQVLFEPLDPPDDVMMVEAGSHHRASIIHATTHPEYILYGGRFSPDGRWIACYAALSRSDVKTRVFIVPVHGGVGSEESEWIPITRGVGFDGEPYWSPDGHLLYFLSDRDGSRCIWAQRLHPVTSRPLGGAFAVQHFHYVGRSLKRLNQLAAVGMCVAPGKLVLALGELTGSIWLCEPASGI